ncbi:kallikrein-12 [Tupaia chinensis]|uniref:kallikrein-12 n=1 Tax=Tupaia chinensis TaxID=246437 RepID=UPI0007046431|nr:kallikrein-12 [Tupaia chinensis]
MRQRQDQRRPTMERGMLLLLCIVGPSKVSMLTMSDGFECRPNSQPWQVALFEGTTLHCGGVLIDRRWVLTAAHCNCSRYWVRLGEHSLSRLDWTEQIRRSGVSVHVTRSAQPLSLPGSCAAAGTKCLVSGWGITNHPWSPFPDRLQCLNISIVPDDVCRAVFPGKITDNMVCAGGVARKDACQGDSGGPLVCGGVLQGLVSWGSVGPCGQEGIPGVYTKICRYVDWIQMVMKSSPPAPSTPTLSSGPL